MLGRRGFSGAQLILVAAVFTLFIYGFYSYHNSQTLLKKTEESLEQLKLINSQDLQKINALSEEKNSLRQVIKTKDNRITELETSKTEHETSLGDKILGMESKLKELQENYNQEKVQNEMLKNDGAQQGKDLAQCRMELEDSQKNEKRVLQESENELAQLRDEVANTKRRNAETNKQLEECLAKQPPSNTTEPIKKKKEEPPHMQINEPNQKESYFKVKNIKPDQERLEQEKNSIKENEKVDKKNVDDSEINQVLPPVIKKDNEKVLDNKINRRDIEVDRQGDQVDRQGDEEDRQGDEVAEDRVVAEQQDVANQINDDEMKGKESIKSNATTTVPDVPLNLPHNNKGALKEPQANGGLGHHNAKGLQILGGRGNAGGDIKGKELDRQKFTRGSEGRKINLGLLGEGKRGMGMDGGRADKAEEKGERGDILAPVGGGAIANKGVDEVILPQPPQDEADENQNNEKDNNEEN